MEILVVVLSSVVCALLSLVFIGLAVYADTNKELIKMLILSSLSLICAFVLAIIGAHIREPYKVIRTYESYDEYTLLILEDENGKIWKLLSEDYYGPGEVLNLSPFDVTKEEVKILKRGQGITN